VPDSGPELEAFQSAADLGIHRTVHAGETGSAEMVKRVSCSSSAFSDVIVYYFSLIDLNYT
jgi:Adenosine deaminase